MLILSRKRNETIIIGEGASQIVITVMRIRENQVRIGIDADPGTRVLRGELLPSEQEAQAGRPSLAAHTADFTVK